MTREKELLMLAVEYLRKYHIYVKPKKTGVCGICKLISEIGKTVSK